mmetsp:Transcript_40586/g.59328  ORF Transcript_40586/g.59328 Transcript_40586/m.59328 type:complete len:141 (+) Transcript_40586:113-535(+)
MMATADQSERSPLRHRLNLFMLIRIIFVRLEKVNPRLLIHAKQVLKDCNALKKKGHPKFQNLAVSIECQMRKTIGENHWKESLRLLAACKRMNFKTAKNGRTVSIPSPESYSSTTALLQKHFETLCLGSNTSPKPCSCSC